MSNRTQLQALNPWTLPNLLSFLRLLGVPVFFWLIVGPRNDAAAVWLLFISGSTDWLDGWLARRLNQYSRLGELMDPLADRLYTTAAIIALTIRDIVPMWAFIALLLRDVVMVFVLRLVKKFGITGLPVHFVGKASTMTLLWAMPLLLLGQIDSGIQDSAYAFGWAFLIWGISLYWIAAIYYIKQAREFIAENSQAKGSFA